MIKTILLTISILVVVCILFPSSVFFGFRSLHSGDTKESRATSRAIESIYNKYKTKLSHYSSDDDVYLTKKKQLQEEMDKEIAEYKRTHKPKLNRNKLGFFVTLPLTVAFLIFTVLVPPSFHQVETGTVAVVRNLGKIEGIRNPGTYFDFYMVKNYEIYDTKVQQDKITTAAYSKDGQTMELEVFLQYQLQSEHIMDIATQYGTLDALQARIETQTIEKTKVVMSSAEAMTIIQNRSQFSNDVSQSVRDGISNDYYVNVKDVVLTNIDFTDEFEKAVEDKVIAEQEKQAAITRAQAELEVAKLEAQKKIEEARGNAEAQKILAQASAEAATYKIIELARTLGYTINETYIYSVDGLETEFDTRQVETDTVIYLGTKYVIDITSGPGAESFKTLVEDYLKYLAYLEKWDGKLPDVVSGDDAISIIVPKS